MKKCVFNSHEKEHLRGQTTGMVESDGRAMNHYENFYVKCWRVSQGWQCGALRAARWQKLGRRPFNICMISESVFNIQYCQYIILVNEDIPR